MGLVDWALARLRPANVALLFHGRSGSSVLAHLLRQHPRVVWAGEIYRKALRSHREALAEGRPAPPIPDPFDFLAAPMRAAGRRAFGLEAKFWHLDELGVSLADYVAGLERLGFHHFVLLERRNALRRYASARALGATRQVFRDGSEAPKLTRVHLRVHGPESQQILGRPANLVPRLRATQADYARAREVLQGRRVLELCYEDDVLPDPRIAYRRVCEFVGLERRDVEVGLGRVNPFPLADIIENWDEVRGALCGTELEWMLELDAASS